ncbi:hypothetical protein HU200_061420 [Digitaria exilis]|uniref:Uncharacterized protein n=1 Tax=Digitaria exilis TaxID=1010633 RepID=A0A835E0T3_9POAL|nr:hypothetical protein HU200_061420 [Digitaria exilis]
MTLEEADGQVSWFLLDVDGMLFEEPVAIAIYFVLPAETQHHHLTRGMVIAFTIKANSRGERTKR